MEFPFFDKNTATSEQKFMLMLLERLEKAEDEIAKMKYPKSLIPEKAQKLWSDVCITSEKKEAEKAQTYIMKNNVPSHILTKIPLNSLSTLDTILTLNLSKDTLLTKLNLRIFLESFQNIDEEVVTWLTKNINI